MTKDVRPPVGGFSHEESLPEYQVIRSKRRSMAIEITAEGKVLVRLPWHASNREAERFVRQYRDRIVDRLDHLRSLPVPQPLSGAQIEALKRRAREELPPLVAKWAEALGVQPRSIRITSARKRFGSCNAKGGLCFSWMLMRYPPKAVEYVVLHEVAHLKHLNHGPAFYALLTRHMPDHPHRRALLRQLPQEGEP